MLHRCIPKECPRVVIDDFITPAEVTELLRIVDIGMAYSSESAKAGGPTIMDLNTGYLRDTLELKNIYSSGSKPGFTAADFAFYKVHGQPTSTLRARSIAANASARNIIHAFTRA